jgi:hypothetical protein
MNSDTDILKSSLLSSVKEVFTDIAEMGLDELIEKIAKEQNLLKEIPIIKWLVVGNDIRTIIQSAFFIKKYFVFLGPINESMADDLIDDNRLIEIFSDKKLYSKIIEQIIISLDRYQTIQKAKMLSILFVETFKNSNFTIKEYNTLIFSIENIHPSLGIECIKSFYDYKNEMNREVDKEKKEKIWLENSSLDYSPLATSGLLKLPIGAAIIGHLGGAFINELGYKFYELVVSKVR